MEPIKNDIDGERAIQMAAITTRQTAGTGATVAGVPLTNAQIDQNFINLNSELVGKQDQLVSGTNIKTINGTSVLGSGNLVIEAGTTGVTSFNTRTGAVTLSSSDVTGALGFIPTSNVGTVTSVSIGGGTTGLSFTGSPITTSGTITLQGTLAIASGGTGATNAGDALTSLGAQATLVSGTNIKTINGSSVLGSGDLLVKSGLEYLTKTANYTAQTNQGILANTSGGSFVVTLPATPTSGDQVVVADATNSFGTNNLTIARNGSTIEGLAENLVLDVSSAVVQLVYDGTTWQVFTQLVTGTGVLTSAQVTTALGYTPYNSANTLAVAGGGTGATTLTGYVKGSGTSAFTASATIPASDISGNISGNAANVTGTVAVANGGTGATTLTGYVKGSGTSAFTASATIPGSDISGNISGSAANVTGTVAVANGGTGATTLTANSVLLGNGTSALQTVAPGTSGNVLTSNGTTWSSTAPAVSLSAANQFTGANTFYNNSGIAFGTATTTNDGFSIQGRSGGTSSFRIILQPETLSGSRTITFPDTAGTAVISAHANVFTNTSGQTFLNGSTTAQDGIVILGRAGGTSSFRTTLVPTTLTANRTLILPDVTGTVLTSAGGALTGPVEISGNGNAALTLYQATDTANSGQVILRAYSNKVVLQAGKTGTATEPYLDISAGSGTGGIYLSPTGEMGLYQALLETRIPLAGGVDINIRNGNYFTKTITTTTTFTVSNVPSSGGVASFILDLTNGASQTVNWWAGMKWAGGTAPTLTASGRDVLGFFTHDGGTTWNGFLLAKDIK